MKNQSRHIVIDARIRQSSTGRYVDRLLEHLQQLNKTDHFTILLKPNDPWQPRAKNFQALAVRFPVFSFNIFNQVLFTRQLYKLKADLVHFAMAGHQPLFYFGKQVTTTHDLTMFYFTRKGRLPAWLHWLRMKGYHLLLWEAHRLGKRIIVPTEYIRDAVAKYYLFTNRKIVITKEASEPPLPGKAIKPVDAPEQFIMYVGSSFPHKNLRRLVQAFEIVQKDNPELWLVLVGKQEYHGKKLARWIKKRGTQQVLLTGFVPDQELKWLYEHCQAYVFPSLSEGFGLPGLEAMTHGAPVVSSTATCLPEVHGEAAHYFDPLDIDGMATAIEDVLSNKQLLEKLIKAGYRQIKKFSWQRMAEQTIEVYNTVLSDS